MLKNNNKTTRILREENTPSMVSVKLGGTGLPMEPINLAVNFSCKKEAAKQQASNNWPNQRENDLGLTVKSLSPVFLAILLYQVPDIVSLCLSLVGSKI